MASGQVEGAGRVLESAVWASAVARVAGTGLAVGGLSCASKSLSAEGVLEPVEPADMAASLVGP